VTIQAPPIPMYNRAPDSGPRPHYRHSWTTRPGGGLDSTCTKCSTVVATNMDELFLLLVEQSHVCER